MEGEIRLDVDLNTRKPRDVLDERSLFLIGEGR